MWKNSNADQELMWLHWWWQELEIFVFFFFVFIDYYLILEGEMLLFVITGSHFLLEEYN